MRLNKFIATAGRCSRRKADVLIKNGKVKVNDKIITKMGFRVNENLDKIIVEGKTLTLPTEFVYLKFNKPKGCICTSQDNRNRKTIFNFVQVPNVRLFSVGRLDYNTEGLLILTNDGNFAQNLIHPSSNIVKEYHCTIKGDIKESELAVLRAGVIENGKRMPKAKVKIIAVNKTEKPTTKISVKINEGQNRQIRRMFKAIGKNIVLLKRVAIGDLRLGGLSRGEYEPLTKKELLCLDFFG